MQSLDPSWLRIELDAIEKDRDRWDRALKVSYDAAMQRVFAYQARISSQVTETEEGLREAG